MNEITITIELVLAALLGGTIGFFRERDKKAAGLRTHTIVCLSCSLLMSLSIFMATKFPGSDAGRIAAQVVTGIGFLGAGTIIQSGETVRGLTTAATIWIAAAIGLSVGAGFYYAAILATIITLIVIEVFRRFEKMVFKDEAPNI